jgi:hypothetical protein
MVWVAAISLLPMLSTYVHLLLVQHATCPEHGEIIDRPASASPDEATDRLMLLGSHARSAWSGMDSDDSHSHSHCTFVLNRRQVPPSLTSVTASIVPPVELHPGFARLDVRPTSEIAVFRLAPKQSPPI